jgi:hypothetical protein
MKRCPNVPECWEFPDELTHCPICNAALISQPPATLLKCLVFGLVFLTFLVLLGTMLAAISGWTPDL